MRKIRKAQTARKSYNEIQAAWGALVWVPTAGLCWGSSVLKFSSLVFFSPHSVSPFFIHLLRVTNGSTVSCFRKHGHKETTKKPESEIGEAPRWSSHEVLPLLLDEYRLALPGHPAFPFTEKKHHKPRPMSLYLLRPTEKFL